MKKEQEQIEALLRAELEREAADILAEIEADESLKDVKCPEDSREKLLQRIQALEEEKAAYEKLSEKDKEALQLGRELQMLQENQVEFDEDAKRIIRSEIRGESPQDVVEEETEDQNPNVVKFTRKKKRVYLLVAVVAILAMAMGMISIGEVPMVSEVTRRLFGESELTKIDSKREDEDIILNTTSIEDDVYKEIKQVFNVEIMRPDYLPVGTEVLKYVIEEELCRATIFYQNKEMLIEYRMLFNYSSQSYGFMREDELLSEQLIEVSGIPVLLCKYKVENKDIYSYLSEFQYQDVGYVLRIDTEEPDDMVMKIISKIKKF